MIDHLTLTVRDLARSKGFYAQALAPLGGAVQMEFEGILGIGQPGKPTFWIKQGDPPTQAMHLAFVAPDRSSVDAFHAAALAAEAKDNGAPGLRADYHPNYYAAFVIDPDGHNVEAVCHAPPAPPRAARRKGSTARPAKTARATASKGAPSRGKKGARKSAARGAARKPARKRGRR